MTRKNINLLIIGVLAVFGVIFGVKADSLSLSCDKTEIAIGESTNCTVTGDFSVAYASGVVTIDVSEHLAISNVKAGAAAGWSVDASTTSGNKYGFKATNSTVGTTTGSRQMFSFTLTLKDSAKKLSAGESCGNICISAATFTPVGGSSVSWTKSNLGTCYAPTYVVCQGSGCTPAPSTPENPKTGEFTDYVLIGGVVVVALIAIIIARKGNKFFEV